MDARRKRFTVILVIFLGWVASLGVLVVRSSRPPVQHRAMSLSPR